MVKLEIIYHNGQRTRVETDDVQRSFVNSQTGATTYDRELGCDSTYIDQCMNRGQTIRVIDPEGKADPKEGFVARWVDMHNVREVINHGPYVPTPRPKSPHPTARASTPPIPRSLFPSPEPRLAREVPPSSTHLEST